MWAEAVKLTGNAQTSDLKAAPVFWRESHGATDPRRSKLIF
jgi:hypothetical protein